ncbi:MAG TPA: ABC transporter permease [bacterium]|nr:ABC transporter permease [bacterium]
MALDILRIAVRSMLSNPSRTLLTMLGVVVGIAAVIALMAVGEGQKSAQMELYEKLGTNRITVRRGWSERARGSNTDLTLETARNLLLECPAAAAVSPTSDTRGRIEYLRNNVEHPIVGALPEMFAVENYELLHGRYFTADEVMAGARVAVLGYSTAQDLFGDRSPVGEYIKLNSKAFVVIGVLGEKGAVPGRSMDEQAIVPLTTFRRAIETRERLERIIVQATSSREAEALEEQIRDSLERQFPAFRQDEDLFFIRNQAAQQEEQEKAAGLIQGFLVVVGGVALFIGGIGIMNIMLVTVSERTPEIGLRKALGATPVGILAQFLVEALVLCLTSGAIGVTLGLYAIKALERYSASETAQLPAPILNPDAIGLSVAVSAAVAIVFGILPAINASRLDPIHALRFE